MTVYGRVDDDLYETTTIEASSIYDQDLGTYFYASAADEESDIITECGATQTIEKKVRCNMGGISHRIRNRQFFCFLFLQCFFLLGAGTASFADALSREEAQKNF